ncbi:hypothetical protein [Mesorhizobium sp. A556]
MALPLLYISKLKLSHTVKPVAIHDHSSRSLFDNLQARVLFHLRAEREARILAFS